MNKKKIVSKDPIASEELVKTVSVVQKQELYYEMPENGMMKKFANFNNPLVCKRKGIIRIESVRRGAHKQANVSYCRTFDKVNRITYGIPTGVDDKGKIILKRFYLPEFKEFNLSNQDEAEEWAILRHHEVMTTGQYVIYDEEKIAQEEIATVSLMRQAISIAEDMKLKDWIPAARFFGKVPEGMSAIKLQSEIMNIATNTPAELINYWEQENREVVDVFNAAQAVGVISHDFAKGWLYEKTLPLGATKEAAIRYISKDSAFCKALMDKIKNLDIASKSIISGKGNSKKSTFDAMNDADDSKEITDLKIKAQLLGIAGYDVMDIEQLKTRVENAEKLALIDDEE